MDTHKDHSVTTVETTPADVSLSPATSAKTTIHWADTTGTPQAELERKFEAMRARNWITDKMVQQYQKHWHCSRELALEWLLSKTSR